MADGNRKYKTDNKTCKVSFKLSEDELGFLNGCAKLVRMNRSEYIRELVKSAGQPDTTFAKDRSNFIRQITGIATNVNQVAKLANTRGYVLFSDVSELKGSLKEITELMGEVLRKWQSLR